MTTADQWSSILADVHKLRRSITERGGLMHVDIRIRGEAQTYYGVEEDIQIHNGCIALKHDRYTTSYIPAERIESIGTRLSALPKTGLEPSLDE